MKFEYLFFCLTLGTVYFYAAVWAGAVLIKWIILLFQDQLEFLRKEQK